MKRKPYRKSLADDGLPMEMFQDVKRAAHRYLMRSNGQEATEYQASETIIRKWMSKRKIPRGYRADDF